MWLRAKVDQCCRCCALAASRASGTSAELLLIAESLYALPALFFGAAAGLVAGAWRATFGERSIARTIRRLRDDRELDVAVCAAVVAAVSAAAVFAAFVAFVASSLVASVQRQQVGAILMSIVVVGALPAFVAAALVFYRATRRLARFAPAVGPVPRALVIVGLGIAAVFAVSLQFVFTRLDWRALNFHAPLLALWYVAVFAVSWIAADGPLARLKQRLPARGAIVMGLVAVALLMPVAFLRGAPAPRTALLLTEHAAGARVLVGVGRRLIDRDGDGYSPFLGGPDCDDSRADVNPGAAEIRGNGIDDNCIGGDRPVDDDAEVNGSSPPPPVQSDVARAFRFDGNVLIVLIDTVRGDRLGLTGYTRRNKSLTPRIDELAARSSYFSRAYAQAPNTARSMPSIFTSRYPSQVVVDQSFKNFSTVLDDNVTVFEALRDAGLHTTGISSHYYFIAERGIQQGFDSYDNEGALSMEASSDDDAAPRVVPKVSHQLAELAASKARFAMFVHLFSPHSTYRAHREFPLHEAGEARFEESYDYEIAYADQSLGTILDALGEHGLADSTMVVVLSDHGEAFGAHRAAGQAIYFHGRTLYDDQLHVPLVIHLPGAKPNVVDQPVAVIDVAPTVLSAIGVQVPAQFTGRSLLDALLGQALAPRPIFAEMLPAPYWDHSAKAMITGDGTHKLLYQISDKRFELYDLTVDPGERRDVFVTQPDVAAALQQEMIDWIEVELTR